MQNARPDESQPGIKTVGRNINNLRYADDTTLMAESGEQYQTTVPVSWETCAQIKKQQLELDMEQLTGSKFGKQYVKAVCCHSAYITSMQSNPTHWKRPWWWKRLKTGGEGTTEDEIVRWHHCLNGHKSEQAPGDGEEQESLACCSL